MFLKQMKIVGFKSFVEATTLFFNANKLAVVGPNGCGKSNVIDAIRWVMGESSPRFLRGDMMSDVIFNGSSHRKAVGVASVEIILDNSNAYLQGAYVKKGDVSLRREIHRNGDSHYYINHQKVRRKDLTDLWLGTGAGSRGYAIIGQNMVNQLIEANPEVLKSYLEEAAGVSKYKDRRKESALRLIQVSENLSRIADLIHELRQSLERLAKESKDAQFFQKLRQESRFFHEQLKRLQAKKTIERQQYVQQQFLLDELEEQKLNKAYQEKEQFLLDFDENFEKIQQELITSEQDCYKAHLDLKQQQEFFLQRQKEHDRFLKEKDQLLEENKDLIQQMTADETSFQTLAESLKTIQGQYQAAQIELGLKKDAIQQIQLKIRAQQQFKNQMRQKIQHNMTQVQIIQAKKEQNILAFHQLKEDIQKFKTKLQNDDMEKLSEKIKLILQDILPEEEYLDELRAEISLLQKELAEALLIREKSQKNFEHYQKEYDILHREMLAKEAAYLGLISHQNVLSQRPSDQWQEISDWLKTWHIPPEWQKIIDFLWHSFLPNYLTTQNEALKAFETLPKAYYASLVKHHPRIGLTSLLSKMKVENVPGGFLNWGKIFVCEYLNETHKQIQLLADDESIICLEGVWLGKNWIYYLPIADHAKSGLASRLNDWQVAQKALTDFENPFQEIQNQLNSSANTYQEIQKHFEKKFNALQEKEQQLLEEKQKLQNLQNQHQFYLQEQDRYRFELHLAEEKYAKFIDQNHTWQKDIEDFEVQIKSYQKQEKQLFQDLEILQKESLDVEKQHAYLLHETHEQKLQITRINTLLENIQQQLPKSKLRHSQMTKRLEELHQQIELFEKDTSHPSQWLLEQQNKIDIQSLLLKERQAQIQEFKLKRQEVSSALDTLKIKHLQCLEKKWKSQNEKAQHQKEFDEVIQQYNADLSAEEWKKLEYHEEKLLKKRIESFELQLLELGDVNLLAVGLFEQEQSRLLQLIHQENDLKQAITELEGAIQTLDSDMQKQLQETLRGINQHLSEIFPQLFGGGEAKFVASCDNLLEATVTVHVQAPGKKQHRIQLLSGGEKALTAVALLFSIFSLNPAPFCLLDEVDAALDDANAQRLANLIDKLSSSVQFILITHNPLTMDVAEELIGVTMQEPGVSRVVAVNMATALDMVNKE